MTIYSSCTDTLYTIYVLQPHNTSGALCLKCSLPTSGRHWAGMSRRKDTPVCTFLRQDGRPTGSRQRLTAEPSCSYVSQPDQLPTSDDLCPWETRAPSKGGGQLASSSARTMPPTGSSLSCSSLHRSSRVSLASTSSVARIDSHASLRSLGYELAQIPSTFAHSTATSVDLAREAIESYRELHTYPMLEKRVRKDAGFGAGSLCTGCALMAGPTRPVSVDHIKPKLLVFGETAPLIYSYTRPAPSRTKQVGVGVGVGGTLSEGPPGHCRRKRACNWRCWQCQWRNAGKATRCGDGLHGYGGMQARPPDVAMVCMDMGECRQGHQMFRWFAWIWGNDTTTI